MTTRFAVDPVSMLIGATITVLVAAVVACVIKHKLENELGRMLDSMALEGGVDERHS